MFLFTLNIIEKYIKTQQNVTRNDFRIVLGNTLTPWKYHVRRPCHTNSAQQRQQRLRHIRYKYSHASSRAHTLRKLVEL